MLNHHDRLPLRLVLLRSSSLDLYLAQKPQIQTQGFCQTPWVSKRWFRASEGESFSARPESQLVPKQAMASALISDRFAQLVVAARIHAAAVGTGTMGLQLGHHWTQRRTTMMMMMVQNQMPFLDDLLRQMLVRKLQHAQPCGMLNSTRFRLPSRLMEGDFGKTRP